MQPILLFLVLLYKLSKYLSTIYCVNIFLTDDFVEYHGFVFPKNEHTVHRYTGQNH